MVAPAHALFGDAGSTALSVPMAASTVSRTTFFASAFSSTLNCSSTCANTCRSVNCELPPPDATTICVVKATIAASVSSTCSTGAAIAISAEV